MTTIPVLISESHLSPPPRSEPNLSVFGDKGKPSELSLRNIEVDTLQESVKSLTQKLGQIFSDLKAVGDFKLKEVEISVEVSADGRIILVGTAGVKGGISLKFQP